MATTDTISDTDTMWACPKCQEEMLYWQEVNHLSNKCESKESN